MNDSTNRSEGKIPLTVILTTGNNCWVAQGVQIDYVAYGETIDEAKINFEKGLMRTFEECSKSHGAINKFLTPMPDDVFAEIQKGDFVSCRSDTTNEKFEFNFLNKAA